jgi:hypothetical protein
VFAVGWKGGGPKVRRLQAESRYVNKLSKNGNPNHGQIWGYENELVSFNLDRIK